MSSAILWLIWTEVGRCDGVATRQRFTISFRSDRISSFWSTSCKRATAFTYSNRPHVSVQHPLVSVRITRNTHDFGQSHAEAKVLLNILVAVHVPRDLSRQNEHRLRQTFKWSAKSIARIMAPDTCS